MAGVDPLASLRATTTILDIAGHEFTLPAWSAGQWLELLHGDSVDVDNLLEAAGARDDVLDLILDGEATGAEVNQAILDAIAVAGGRDWWEVLNLLNVMWGRWEIVYGRLLLTGIDVWRIPLGALLDAVYAMYHDRLEASDRIQFENNVKLPPVGTDAPLVDEESEGQAFLAMMNGTP